VVTNNCSLLLSAVSFLFRYGFCVLAVVSSAFGKDNHASKGDFPFSSKYIEVRGARMHHVVTGRGDPILLLHGNPTNVYIWRNIIPRLAKHSRVIAVDLIGFGKSGKPAIEYRFADHAAYLEGFIEKMGLRNITLVMHDWGSALGFDYASRHENNIRALAFFEALLVPIPPLDQWPNHESAEAFRLYRTPEVGWNLIVNENNFVEKRLQDGIIRPLSEQELQHYREPFLDRAARKPVWRWPNELPIAGEPADVAAVQMHYLMWLQKTEVPKLLIFAHPGALTTEPVVAWAKANLPNLNSVDIGTGIHNLQEDHPAEIGEAIAGWLEKFQQGATRLR
jgi:haloalkane dehalogenase